MNVYGTVKQYRDAETIKKHNAQVRAWAAPMALDVAAIFWDTWLEIEKELPDTEETVTNSQWLDSVTERAIIDHTGLLMDTLTEYERKVWLAGAIEQGRNLNCVESFLENRTLLEADFTRVNRALDYARQHAAEMVTEIDSTTRRQINELVQNAVENGTSYNTLAGQIKNKFEQFSVPKPQHHIPNRATLVAVTELANAYSEGNMETARYLQDQGLTLLKYWQTCNDARVSAGCRENQAAGWIPLDQTFPSGHDHPPRFPGCRCDCRQEPKEEENVDERPTSEWTSIPAPDLTPIQMNNQERAALDAIREGTATQKQSSLIKDLIAMAALSSVLIAFSFFDGNELDDWQVGEARPLEDFTFLELEEIANGKNKVTYYVSRGMGRGGYFETDEYVLEPGVVATLVKVEHLSTGGYHYYIRID